MNYADAMSLLEREGFSWARLRDIFPFGDISLREGNYQRLVAKAVETCQSDADRELLLDLLDTQACIFLEQVWIQNEQSGVEGEDPPFMMEAHFVSAWLQINSNIRGSHRLPRKNGRDLMLKLSRHETLLSRLLRSAA